MSARFIRHHKTSKTALMARKGAGIATEAAWVTLGGDPSQIIAMRNWLADKARGGR